MRILAISGSLRRDSHNTSLLRAAVALLPPEVEVVVYERLGEVPPFNEDEVVDRPAAAQDLWDAVQAADGVLIATPEYNSSIPGVLKNALDWLSRPLLESPLRNLPAAVIGASTGVFGAVWSQAETRKVLGAIGARVVDRELPVAAAHEAFGDTGRLADTAVEAELERSLTELVAAITAREAARAGATAPGEAGCAGMTPPVSAPHALPLPLADAPCERSDAAANRARILAAARDVLAAEGAAGLSMNAVAAAAGVGKGTIFRRFGDRDGLTEALLDVHTAELQNAFLSGPPPLGPGAPPCARLEAFMRTLVAFEAAHLEILLAARRMPDGAPSVYGTFLIHVRTLLEQIDPALDAPVLAELLLSALAPENLARLLRAGEADATRVADGIIALMRGTLGAAASSANDVGG